ncbi:PorT family protein [Hymenobacter sp. BT175]|uniref:outer membrane beta-barrel protein n=1 Tax=Hymenobacter translucens TaxID=2886507 RepID=UPI001D0E3EDF|nr:outer membrane beta-barrel protein [Hymenobacter translucens]MCC2547516.1 PorT family protein [Hymenobacter translucens]
MRLSFLWCLSGLLLLAGSATAQRPKFEPGYLLTPAGDTLKGFLRRDTRNAMALEMAFRTSADDAGTQRQVFPRRFRGAGFRPGATYVARALPLNNQDTLWVFVRQLVSGHASLYQLDYSSALAEKGLYAADGPFLLLQKGPKEPMITLPVQGSAALLKTYLADCPSLGTIGGNVRTADRLTSLLARYNACWPQEPTRDLRALPTQSATRTGWRPGVILGGQLTQIGYQASGELPSGETERGFGFLIGVQAFHVGPSQFSYGAGLQVASRASSYSTTFNDGGEFLSLRHHLTITTVQVPLLARLFLRPGGQGVYVTAGPVAGLNFRNKTVISTPMRVVQGGGSGYVEKQTNVEWTPGYREFTVGGMLGAGLRQPVSSRLAFVMELHGGLGSELKGRALYGAAAYSTMGVTTGLEF